MSANRIFRRPLSLVLVLGLLGGLGACAAGEPPRATLAVAGTKVSDAERAGAAEHAPAELDSARRKLDAAEEANRDESYEVAARLAAEAEADASLAEAKSRAAVAENAAAALDRGIGTLKEEATPRPLGAMPNAAPAAPAPPTQPPATIP